jgi:hypothetical protein
VNSFVLVLVIGTSLQPIVQTWDETQCLKAKAIVERAMRAGLLHPDLACIPGVIAVPMEAPAR